jgi:hypothetical protein
MTVMMKNNDHVNDINVTWMQLIKQMKILPNWWNLVNDVDDINVVGHVNEIQAHLRWSFPFILMCIQVHPFISMHVPFVIQVL